MTAVDHSNQPPALFANNMATVPANQSRQGFSIQNQSGFQIQVVLTDGFGGASTIFVIDPLGAGLQGGDWSIPGAAPFRGQIKIYTQNTTDQFAAREW